MSDNRESLQLLKPSEAAKRLAISERTLWSLTQDGTIPCIRLGRSVRYCIDDLKQVIRSLQIEDSRE